MFVAGGAILFRNKSLTLDEMNCITYFLFKKKLTSNYCSDSPHYQSISGFAWMIVKFDPNCLWLDNFIQHKPFITEEWF